MAATHPTRHDLTAEQVRALLDYDPETGVFRWRPRPASMFTSGQKTAEHAANIWNSRYAGKIAGGVSCEGRSTPYWCIDINRRHYYAHRLAWLYVHGEWPPEQVDHIDSDGLNNRIANLRLATRSENCRNSRTPRTNTSGLKGVSASGCANGRWRARIKISGREHHLGTFDTPEEAHAAYAAAAREHFGEFGRSE